MEFNITCSRVVSSKKIRLVVVPKYGFQILDSCFKTYLVRNLSNGIHVEAHCLGGLTMCTGIYILVYFTLVLKIQVGI